MPTVISTKSAVLRTWSRLWPAAVEMCLLNRQIEFMASFFHHMAAPPVFKRRNTIPPSLQRGPGLLSLSLVSADLSFSRHTLQAPAAIPLSLLTNPSALVSYPPHSTSSLLLFFSSHLIPLFQSFRSSFKPGPRGQEFGLVFQTSLLALLW